VCHRPTLRKWWCAAGRHRPNTSQTGRPERLGLVAAARRRTGSRINDARSLRSKATDETSGISACVTVPPNLTEEPTPVSACPGRVERPHIALGIVFAQCLALASSGWVGAVCEATLTPRVVVQGEGKPGDITPRHRAILGQHVHT
jgi:hypothetical protein